MKMVHCLIVYTGMIAFTLFTRTSISLWLFKLNQYCYVLLLNFNQLIHSKVTHDIIIFERYPRHFHQIDSAKSIHVIPKDLLKSKFLIQLHISLNVTVSK